MKGRRRSRSVRKKEAAKGLKTCLEREIEYSQKINRRVVDRGGQGAYNL